MEEIGQAMPGRRRLCREQMAESKEEKRAAQDDRDSWKRTSIWSAGLGATLSVGAAGVGVAAVGTILGGPVFLVGALVTIALKTNADLKTVEADRRIEDPPRVDFYEPTVARMVLPYRDGFGPTELERMLSAFARVTVETVSLESAMVTAEERMMGALLYGAEDVAELRAAERRSLRAAAGRWNLQLALHSRQLAGLIQRDVLDDEEFQGALEGLAWPGNDEMREQDLNSLFREVFPGAVRTIAGCGYPAASFPGASLPSEAERASEQAELLVNSVYDAGAAAESYGRVLLESAESEEGGALPPSSAPFPFSATGPVIFAQPPRRPDR